MWVFSQRKSKPSFRKEPCQGFRAWHQSQASYQSGVSHGWVFQVKGLSFVRRQTLSHSLLAQWSLVRKRGGPWKKDQAMPLKPGLTSDASSHWAYRFSANCLFQSAYVLCQHVPRMLPAKQKTWLFSIFEEGKQRSTSAHHSRKHPSCRTLSPARNRPGDPVFIIFCLQEGKLLAWLLSPLCWPRARKLKRRGKGALHTYLGKQISEDPWRDPKGH